MDTGYPGTLAGRGSVLASNGVGTAGMACNPQPRRYGFPTLRQGGFLGSGISEPLNSTKSGQLNAVVAQINHTGFGSGLGLVPVVGEPGGLMPEARRFGIGHPSLEHAFRWRSWPEIAELRLILPLAKLGGFRHESAG